MVPAQRARLPQPISRWAGFRFGVATASYAAQERVWLERAAAEAGAVKGGSKDALVKPLNALNNSIAAGMCNSSPL